MYLAIIVPLPGDHTSLAQIRTTCSPQATPSPYWSLNGKLLARSDTRQERPNQVAKMRDIGKIGSEKVVSHSNQNDRSE